MRRALLLVVTAALAAAAPASAFTPTNPLALRQWYLQDDHAFDAWPTPPTNLQPVKVAIVDSGLDCSLPDFAGRLLAERSFVGGSPCTDSEGHGTFVAGEIAADLGTSGVVGIAYTAQLLIAKVVTPDGTIPLAAESDAIRWAVDNGARVINLSLGGVRDPGNPSEDTYSPLEEQAVEYAYAHGAVLVAAVGNGDEAPSQPWPYASYPAALPHVIGVSALTRTGNVPDYSNRDPVFNDLSAPGSSIFSTFPAALTALRTGCPDQGYSDCGTEDYRNAEGTSFAAPQVSAAAAVLLAVDPLLTNSQVGYLLERSADDVNATNGCPRCGLLRDPFSGWGRLDVAKAVEALAGPIPPPDSHETNDDAGTSASTVWGRHDKFQATIDYWDDPVDVYRIQLQRKQLLQAEVTEEGPSIALELWKPRTVHVDRASSQSDLAAQSSTKHLRFRALTAGWYYLEVRADSPGFAPYTLQLTKTATRA
ncbi:MAG TPA: S8 family serine peptidase [Gaiellaceae bacterium]|jgi:subtilisin family serine protease|nr:S8 family serine peptidase [Gaiellaceae bacterium]